VPVAQKDVIALLFYPKVAFEGILNQAILRKSRRIAESGKDPSRLNRHMVAGDFVCSFPSPASRRTSNRAMQESDFRRLRCINQAFFVAMLTSVATILGDAPPAVFNTLLLEGIEHHNCLSIFTEKSQSPLAEIIRTCLAKSVGEQLAALSSAVVGGEKDATAQVKARQVRKLLSNRCIPSTVCGSRIALVRFVFYAHKVELALAEPEVVQLLLLMETNKNRKISKQECMKFMETEVDRLDKDNSGDLDAKDLKQSKLRVSHPVIWESDPTL
jgi:hypothetical protein